jgi:hypothetical protein
VEPGRPAPAVAVVTDGAGIGQWAEGDAFVVLRRQHQLLDDHDLESCVPGFDCRNTVNFADATVVRSLVVTSLHYVLPVKR